jgi:archaellum biogenesis protein FlaJ (TadC family)
MNCLNCGHEFTLISTGGFYTKGAVKCPQCGKYVHYYFGSFRTNVSEYLSVYTSTNTVLIFALLSVFHSPALTAAMILLSQVIFGFRANFLITKFGVIHRSPEGYELNKRKKESILYWFVMSLYILCLIYFVSLYFE